MASAYEESPICERRQASCLRRISMYVCVCVRACVCVCVCVRVCRLDHIYTLFFLLYVINAASNC